MESASAPIFFHTTSQCPGAQLRIFVYDSLFPASTEMRTQVKRGRMFSMRLGFMLTALVTSAHFNPKSSALENICSWSRCKSGSPPPVHSTASTPAATNSSSNASARSVGICRSGLLVPYLDNSDPSVNCSLDVYGLPPENSLVASILYAQKWQFCWQVSLRTTCMTLG